MSFVEELKRRNVFKVGIAYLVGAWLLIQFSDILLDNMGAPPWVLQAIMLVLFIGFLIALFVAWAFELTPEGIKREEEVDRSRSIAQQTGKKLTHAIVVMLSLAVVYLLFDKFSGSGNMGSESNSLATQSQAGNSTNENLNLTPSEPAPVVPTVNRLSIAVLPFTNRSNREEDQFFTDGIHDDLLTTIANIGSMKVISRTSVMEYKGTTKKIPEIARELGVANVLEGGIQRSGNQVRINVQLIDAKTDEHLWAQIFDRELTADNLFAIQSEISKAIAEALQTTLSPAEIQRIDTQPTDNLLAMDAYLRGKQLIATRDSEKIKLGIEEFNKAVTLDPNFALAWVGVADSNNLLSEYGTLPKETSDPIAEAAINRALAINDQLGEAYASRADILMMKNQDAEAEADFLKAVELSPNYATAWHWYSLLLGRYPLRINEMIETAEKAATLDPRSSIISNMLGVAYWNRGLFSVAERQFKKLNELDPDFAQGYRSLASLYIYYLSQYEAGLEYAKKTEELDPGNINSIETLVNLYLELDDLDSAQRAREQMAELDANNASVGFADVSISLYNNNTAGTHETVNWLLPRIKDNLGGKMYLANVELALGNTRRAREIFLSAVPGWLDPAQWQELLGRYQTNGCIFAWILINTGDEDIGQKLLQQSTAFMDQALPAVYEHPDLYSPELCYLTAGNTDKALQSIETQLAHNHLFGWNNFHKLPMFDLIRDEPRYQAAVSERNRRVAAQKEAIEKSRIEAGP